MNWLNFTTISGLKVKINQTVIQSVQAYLVTHCNYYSLTIRYMNKETECYQVSSEQFEKL